jgi:hypothetical protein
MGAAAAAEAAIERIHGAGNEFILHLDVDVIADFQATNYPSADGLRLEEVRDALEVFANQKHLAAIEVCAYNPTRDPDGSGAKTIVDLVAGILAKRLEVLSVAASPEPAAMSAAAGTSEGQAAPPASGPAAFPVESETVPPAAAPGEAWSSESLDAESGPAGDPPDGGPPEAAEEPGESHS